MSPIRKKYLQPLRSIRGSTLLEVMVSVFIMAFGIMALMLAQIKSVSNVREAEMQTRVAQAVQNLASDMLGNPDAFNTISASSTSDAVKLKYTSYNTSEKDVTPSSGFGNVGLCATDALSDAGNMKTCNLENFEKQLQNALPNATGIKYAIATAGDTTTITVKWTEAGGSNDNADNYQFTYSAVVGD